MEKMILIDPDKCRGCMRCELACSFNKEKSFNNAHSRIRIFAVQEVLAFMPVVCQHCETPLCTYACPTKAIRKDPATGIVKIDENLCIGCLSCFAACPLSGIFTAPDLKVPIKCDLCDGEPKCVEACDYGALQFVDKESANYTKMANAAKAYAKLMEIVTGRKG